MPLYAIIPFSVLIMLLFLFFDSFILCDFDCNSEE